MKLIKTSCAICGSYDNYEVMYPSNFSQEDWWMENNSHRGLAWFFHSDDRIDQFINLKVNIKKTITRI